MKLWNQVGELEVIGVEIWVALGQMFEEMDQPLVCNVIRNHNITNSEILQYGCDDIVYIDIPKWLSEPLHQRTGLDIPFCSL